MKNLILFIIISAIVVSGCKKKEDDDPTPSKYKVNYKNQVLQGKINGETWIYAQGEVSSTSWDVGEISHYFEIIDTAQSDSCFIISGKRSKLIFHTDDTGKIIQPTVHELYIDWNTLEGKTVTLVSYSETSVDNIIAAEGAYEIISVDTVAKLVTGKMDAYIDKDNFINGNFTLKYCTW